MKSLMIQGTTSSAGKSTLVTALCRIFAQKGIDVYPFKSQNMSRNFMHTNTGKRISSAQFVQAHAAKIEPSEYMNPVLLVPETDVGSEVVILGKTYKFMKAREYFDYKKELKEKIKEIYKELSAEHELMVIEGAGSPAEINLNENDFVNMGMAEIADANVLIVTDIDRGGSFASLYGTLMLLKEGDRKRVKGFIINKFRGDKSLLDSGITMIEELTGVPVLGVIPYTHLEIVDEDSIIEYRKKAHCCFDPVMLEEEIERLADIVTQNMDIDRILKMLED